MEMADDLAEFVAAAPEMRGHGSDRLISFDDFARSATSIVEDAISKKASHDRHPASAANWPDIKTHRDGLHFGRAVRWWRRQRTVR